jgi:cystathionine beta-lyase/cystathionine gamma-synthase
MKFATRAIHAGEEISAAGDIIPPIHLSSIYSYAAPGEPQAGYEYIRYGNPTRSALEQCLAALEGAADDNPALCFSSGQAATDCVMRLLRPGDRLLMAQDVYGGTTQLAEKILRPAGIDLHFADAIETCEFVECITPGTRLVWIESPSNPLLRITDIRAVCHAAHRAGALVAIDNTFATPSLQCPLEMGVDIVMHSTTKYIGGHSDLLGGALVFKSRELREQVYAIQKLTGGVAAPFDCWLTLRGVRTLDARMKVHNHNAQSVAEFLSTHALVERVHYPGLKSHPQHALASAQMRGYGGMVSFEIVGGGEAAKRILQSTRIFKMAASLGGVESIISYPTMMSHVGLSSEERHRRGIADGLLRLSVGIEDSEDLCSDLAQALAQAG